MPLLSSFSRKRKLNGHATSQIGRCVEDHMAGPIHAQINGKSRIFESDPETTLLFALREELGLTGTKYGCGEGQCGACTVLLNGTPRRSCQLSVRDAEGKSILPIEGFEQNRQLHPARQTFLDQP